MKKFIHLFGAIACIFVTVVAALGTLLFMYMWLSGVATGTNEVFEIRFSMFLIGVQVLFILLFLLCRKRYILAKGGEKAEKILAKKAAKRELRDSKASEKEAKKMKKNASLSKKRDEETAKEIEENNQRMAEFHARQEAKASLKKEIELSEKAPSKDTVRNIYRFKGAGFERILSICCYALGIGLFALSAIVACQRLSIDVPNRLLKALGYTSFAWASLIIFLLIGGQFAKIYKEAMLRVFIVSENNALYCCELLPRFEKTSYHAVKAVRLYKNMEASEYNKAAKEAAYKYLLSQEFEEKLSELVAGKEVHGVECAYSFMYLPNAKLEKKGRFYNTITYTKNGEPVKIRVHKSFGLEY